jgi:hypothetical protein
LRSERGERLPLTPAGSLGPRTYALRIVLAVLGDFGDLPKAPIDVGA